MVSLKKIIPLLCLILSLIYTYFAQNIPIPKMFNALGAFFHIFIGLYIGFIIPFFILLFFE